MSMILGGGPVWLDITRLLQRAARGSMSGIDRVELAYAEHLPAKLGDRLRFTAWNPLRGIVELPQARCMSFVAALSAAWRSRTMCQARMPAASLWARSVAAPQPRHQGGGCYLLISHSHLDHPAVIETFLHRTGAAFVPLVHDLIPITHPEYARVGAYARHRKRIETVQRLADGIIVNSEGTGRVLRGWLNESTPIHAASLGASSLASVTPDPGRPRTRPYFVCVGTIEPRKNHLLLLNLWRKISGEGIQLVLVGRRGWENEMVVDMLERCPALHGAVEELGRVSDQEMAGLLAGARALLLPSFAEGFGLPVAEALAQGVPVICSDLPELREAGQNVPEYVDPLDTPAWERLVIDYARPDSSARSEQFVRMADWRTPTWEAHVDSALEFAKRIALSKVGAKAISISGIQPSFRRIIGTRC